MINRQTNVDRPGKGPGSNACWSSEAESNKRLHRFGGTNVFKFAFKFATDRRPSAGGTYCLSNRASLCARSVLGVGCGLQSLQSSDCTDCLKFSVDLT
ncbi:hypothetical protein ZHAS_00009767 [Anopheles sinensis]|uniref:Uncharacterized protein n=1 Tax=Anopheles sinensis TaxID=74873 RepID=A0A084VVW2_ANOSI|nr:hypothetical protein ZHAS_00009767 [Anopheles sinensis]